jgi:hypothetical protein
MTQSWIERAEAAMRGEVQPGIELLPHGRPALLDALGRRALVAPFAAAFLWAGALFAEGRAHPLDPLALLLRLLAFAATLRALVALGLLARRLRDLSRKQRYQLALADEGLLLRTPQADYAVLKQDVADVREPGHWGERSALRWSDVYVVTRPDSGRLFLAVPPLIERTPGVLAERLMRWRGVTAADSDAERPEPPAVELPSKLFDAVAAGEQPAGVAAIPHGRGYLKRGPYATVLLGAAILDGLLRSPAAVRERLGAAAPFVLALCLVVVPLMWLLQARRALAARKGLALLLTPGELLLRTRAGVQRVRWSQVQRVEVVARNAWSILHGAHQSRTLVVQRKDGETLSYAEVFLGVPAEVAAALCDAYRKGTLP